MSVKVGVIGTGTIGSDHVTRLATQVVGSRVSGVFDVATARAQEIADAVGALVHESWEALVVDPNVDAVLIASPGDLHPEQVLACLAANKPVLCEKPLATTTSEAQRVVDAEVALGKRLIQIGFMRRYDRGFLAVKRAMEDGTIGEPLLAHSLHRNPTVPNGFVGEMSLTDSVVHEFDTYRWLFGKEIVAITVVPVKRSPLAAPHLRDPQIVLFEMADGEVVTVESFVNCQYGYDVRCEIVGSLGTVSLDNPRTTVVIGTASRAERVPADWRERFGVAYVDELQAWITGLAAGVVGGPSAWDGYAATAIAASAVESFTKGARIEVVLPDMPAVYA